MRGVRGFPLVLVIAALCLPAGKADARDWPEKPRLEEYQDYSEFLQAMTAYRKWLQQSPVSPPLTITIVAPASPTLTELTAQSPEMLDPLSEDYPPPLTVTGPEDLEEAVEKAKKFLHPVYTARLRYRRTTSLSFPLPHARNELLAEAVVRDLLFGLSGPAEAWPDLISQLIHEDDMLAVERAGTYNAHWMEAPVAQDVVRSAFMLQTSAGVNLGVPEVMIDSYRR